jgi:hypothetical protein
MKLSRFAFLGLSFVVLLLPSLACGLSNPTSKPQAPISPIVIGQDLTTIDLCQAIPKENIEAVIGRKLVRDPEPFMYYDSPNSSGCSYDAGKDTDGNAYFGYVALTPLEDFDNQPLYLNEDVIGIGDAAYFNNGADARQLWVRLEGKVAFVVAFGDVENEDGARAIAELLIEAIQ